MAYRPSEALTKDRLHGFVVAGLVMLVLLAWGGFLVYLGIRFL